MRLYRLSRLWFVETGRNPCTRGKDWRSAALDRCTTNSPLPLSFSLSSPWRLWRYADAATAVHLATVSGQPTPPRLRQARSPPPSRPAVRNSNTVLAELNAKVDLGSVKIKIKIKIKIKRLMSVLQADAELRCSVSAARPHRRACTDLRRLFPQ